MASDADRFSDIRPYHDEEIQPVIRRLTESDEFISAIGRFKFPKLIDWFGWAIKPAIRTYLARKWAKLDTVAKVQDEVAGYMGKMIQTTTSKVTYSGLEKLDNKQAYLFISTHRDIAMDPSFVNWGLYHHGHGTVRIAIGDNLLRKPYVTDLMRLNKSFIVKRSVKAPREMMKALSTLSAYIFDSLQTGNNIWIAQKEGRAKDGDDKTEAAILKMLYMNGKKSKVDFAEYINQLKIVPVAISYEYDPGDVSKAKELYQTANEGGYQKSEFEDIESIVQGIVGYKGHVNVAFGEPLSGGFEDAEQVARALDSEIARLFYLHPSNLLAANSPDAERVNFEDRRKFEDHINSIPSHLRDLVKAMYSKPVDKRNQL